MTRHFALVVLLGATAIASPALADLEPVEVWDGFRDYLDGVGYDVEANVTGGGAELTAGDVVLTFPLPEEDGMIVAELGTIVFSEVDEGVDIAFPAVMPIRFDVTAEGVTTSGVVEYRHDGLSMLVTGAQDDLNYEYTANRLDLVLTDLSVDGEAVGREIARFDMTFAEVSGVAAVQRAETRTLAQELDVGTMTFDAFFTDPEDSQSLFQLLGEFAGVTISSAADFPLAIDMTTVEGMMAEGFTTSSAMTHDGGNISINVTESGDVTAITSTSDMGELAVDVSDTAIGYAGTSAGVNMQMAGGELPFPIALTAAETAFGVEMPLAPGEEPQDFGASFTLGDFEMNDMIWNLFDPGKALPRDPATLALDLSGTAKILIDMMNPDPAAMMSDEMPAELESLTLNTLVLDAAGAVLTGAGGFTFDNTDLDTFGGFPRPLGEINLELSGANKLIDTLVQMGLLPEEQAMGARMMMAMFAQPVGDDQLASKIEVNEAGHVLANGQRIQ